MSEEEESWEIEAILKMRHTPEGTKYLVKWKGWSNDDNTWEPIEHLEGCQELLIEFLEREEREKSQRMAEKEPKPKVGKRGRKPKESKEQKEPKEAKKPKEQKEQTAAKQSEKKQQETPKRADTEEPHDIENTKDLLKIRDLKEEKKQIQFDPKLIILGFASDSERIVVRHGDGSIRHIPKDDIQKVYPEKYLRFLENIQLDKC